RENAVTQHRQCNTRDVLRRHRRSTREERMRLGAEYECLSCARTCAPPHRALHEWRCRWVIRTCRTSKRRRETQRRLRCSDVANSTLQRDRFISTQHGTKRLGRCAGGGAKDRDFVVHVRVAHTNVEQEAIELRFRQWIRAFLLDRVLRGQHEEW